MIFLRPIGGLCNRLRAIDSMISICRRYQKDLTILWVMDFSLNCSFQEMFEIPEFVDFKLRIINCPEGFPEQYLSYKAPIYLELQKESKPRKNIVRLIKLILKGIFLNKKHREVIKSLNKISTRQILSNDFFTSLYTLENLSVNEMDAKFISLAQPRYEPVIENNEIIYISSCYRIYPLENNYEFFIPKINIRNQITEVVKNFDKTIGLHIRRSDHEAAKSVSSTERFIEIINNEIEKNSSCNFFLSTDDEITKLHLVNEFGGKILTNKVSSYDRSNKNAIIEAVVDLYCLSNTEKIYGSHHSTFSQTAAHMGKIIEITAKLK